MSSTTRRNPGRPKGSRDKQPRKRKDPGFSRSQSRPDCDSQEQVVNDQGNPSKRRGRDLAATPSTPTSAKGSYEQQALFENLQALLGRNRASFAAISAERTRSDSSADQPLQQEQPPSPPPTSTNSDISAAATQPPSDSDEGGSLLWHESSKAIFRRTAAAHEDQGPDEDVAGLAAAPASGSAPLAWAAAGWTVGQACGGAGPESGDVAASRGGGGRGDEGSTGTGSGKSSPEDPFHSDWPFW